LVAYLVADKNQQEKESASSPSMAEKEQRLQEQLELSLPHYLVPRHYIWLQKMPLGSDGKLDRKALPKPTEESSRGRSGTDAKPLMDTIVRMV
jgi:acyl-CoA synthetase (AMP-forming)/AMP-acid ligase II